MTKQPIGKPVVGWREWVVLPELCDTPIKAKVDTGARTSSLHVFNLEVSTGTSGSDVATFEIHPEQHSTKSPVVVETAITEFREVRSSNGQVELRPVITAAVNLGEHDFEIELTLTSRDEMGFRMLIGRTALRDRFLIDPARSFQQGKKS